MIGGFQVGAFQPAPAFQQQAITPNNPVKAVFYVPLRKKRVTVPVRTKSVRVN